MEIVPLFRAILLAILVSASLCAQSATVLVLRFQNNSTYTELQLGRRKHRPETLRLRFRPSQSDCP